MAAMSLTCRRSSVSASDHLTAVYLCAELALTLSKRRHLHKYFCFPTTDCGCNTGLSEPIISLTSASRRTRPMQRDLVTRHRLRGCCMIIRCFDIFVASTFPLLRQFHCFDISVASTFPLLRPLSTSTETASYWDLPDRCVLLIVSEQNLEAEYLSQSNLSAT